MAENKVDVGGWINEAFELYKANFGLLCIATLVAGLLGALTCGVLAGPLFAGVIMIVLRVSRQTEPKPQIGDVFKGFGNYSGRFLTGWTGWTGFGQGGSRASAADTARLRSVEGRNEGVAVEEAAQSIHRADRIFPGC